MALTVGTNSWISLSDALTLAQERVDLAGFIAYADAEDGDYSLAEAGLIQAYHAIKRFMFLVPGFMTVKPEPFLITDLTVEEFALLPSAFLYALKMAQVLEADSALNAGSDTVESYAASRRRAGIIEEQIGESMTKFATTSPGESASTTVSSRTLSMLSGYIYRGIRIARA
jgi:hypothetical protein